MTWKLQAISAELAGQEISIDRDMLVGRHQAADIVLQSSEISRKHAAFLRVEDALWLQDLASSNGTFVNDARITEQVLLKDGDIVQFASLKFSLLAPVADVAIDSDLAQSVEAAVESPAQHMNDQGMPSLKERDASVELTRDGMPTNVGVPKPAPIPQGVDVSQATPEPKPVPVEVPESRVEQVQEQQKNTMVGLMTVIAIIILAVLAFVFFK
ncbi:FHA domain-containing protein [uncultured Acinetobacter sp.]|uniref:FHA domain-containing protein n=1 Tax=uncultured Acinetobacter sp. TaxID=165433 RepID=UPI0026149352|nr:FHA domain-containing protein [uncultured Acinetobacter sp.]